MAASLRVTFKRGPTPRGLNAAGNPYPTVDIKGDGKIFGTIIPPNWQDGLDGGWRISIMVKDDGSSFDNMLFKKVFDSEMAARDFIKNKINLIVDMYKLHFLGD